MQSAIATSSHAHDMVRCAAAHDLVRQFSQVVTGPEVARSKPAPDIFLEAANRLGCRPEDCIVLEDSIAGVRAGIAANMRVIMIPDLICPDDETEALCTAVVKTLMEAIPVIEGIVAEQDVSDGLTRARL